MVERVTREELAEALSDMALKCKQLRNEVGGLRARESTLEELRALVLLSRLDAEREGGGE